MFSSKINDQSIPVSTPKPKPKSENVAPPDLYKIIHPEVDEMDLQYFTYNVLYKYLQCSSFSEAKKKYAGIAVARPATPHIVTVRHHIFCPKFIWKIISTVALIMLLKSPPPFL